MKNILIILLLGSGLFLNSQVFLPYSSKNVCLDKVVNISGGPVKPTKNLVVRDLNGDGFDDVVLADTLGERILVYANNTTGGFNQVTVAGIQTSNYNSLDAGDFDGDGDLDLAVSVGDSVRIYFNQSAFVFTQFGGFHYDSPSIYKDHPNYIKAGKFNNDNLDDIVILTSQVTGTLGHIALVYRNISSGLNNASFSLDYTTPPLNANLNFNKINRKDTINISIGNLDNDGNNTNEIVLANKADTNNVCVLQNVTSGPGALQFVVKNVNTANLIPFVSAKISVSKVEIIDVNNDGVNDLIALARAKTAGNTVLGFAFYNGATSAFNTYSLPSVPNTFQLPIVSSTPSNNILMPTDFKCGDINGDGYLDIIGINNNFLVVLMHGGPFTNSLIPFDANSLVVVGTGSLSLHSEEVNIGRFDNNLRTDIFIKPWKNPSGGIVGVIPNFSTKLGVTPISTTVCPGSPVALTALPSPSLLPNHTVDWYETPGNLLGSGNPYTVTTTGKFYPVLHFNFPSGVGTCSINARTMLDTVVITNKSTPVFSISNPKPEVCPDEKASVEASGNGSTYQYSWYDGINPIGSGSLFISPPINGSSVVTVVAFDPISTCTAANQFTITNFSISTEPLLVSKNPLCPGDSSIISFLGAQNYTWSTASGSIIATDVEGISVKPVTAENYSVNIIDENGCALKRFVSIQIDTDCKIKIYNTVTLNGDNNNDKFIIDNIGQFKRNNVTIFNRWGKVLFNESGYDNETVYWPKNKNLSGGTYFYLIDLGNGTPIKGWIELIK
ncbi:MAG: gliding motility-associated C-terminal domain-containing protein [Sphingobacteriaceae bacterium]|nr:gliding motility-associated C-terminal domain-containing protein [Sphingobacteriaceae bacterium]